MTIARALLTGAAIVGAFVLGIWMGPTVMQRTERRSLVGWVPGSSPEETAAALADHPEPKAHAARLRTPSVRAASLEHGAAGAPSPIAPALEKRIQPLLNRGANMQIASEGFRSGEQFATVAHAARNASIPFMLLKHQVLNEHQTLVQAIHASNPELDAATVAKLAQAEAQSDVAATD